MRFTALILLFIAAMLISVTQTASPLAAQILTATPAAQSHDLYDDGHEETYSDQDQHRYIGNKISESCLVTLGATRTATASQITAFKREIMVFRLTA